MLGTDLSEEEKRGTMRYLMFLNQSGVVGLKQEAVPMGVIILDVSLRETPAHQLSVLSYCSCQP